MQDAPHGVQQEVQYLIASSGSVVLIYMCYVPTESETAVAKSVSLASTGATTPSTSQVTGTTGYSKSIYRL